jgi:fumarylpyruvate hydrolase
MGFGKNYLNLESEIIAIKTVEQLIFLKAESTLISYKKISFPQNFI